MIRTSSLPPTPNPCFAPPPIGNAQALVYQAMLRSGQDANFTTRSDTLERLALSYRMLDDDKSIFTPEGLREFKTTEGVRGCVVRR